MNGLLALELDRPGSNLSSATSELGDRVTELLGVSAAASVK